MAYPYGVHIAVVRIDREAGAVSVERYLVAYDIGKAVNPMLVEGQIAGGAAQGLGGALFEEFLYDARGEPLSRQLRRLSDADRARNSAHRSADNGRRAEPAQPTRA
jgi:CO/xanthine dehydrogenase Mo-binding subunit